MYRRRYLVAAAAVPVALAGCADNDDDDDDDTDDVPDDGADDTVDDDENGTDDIDPDEPAGAALATLEDYEAAFNDADVDAILETLHPDAEALLPPQQDLEAMEFEILETTVLEESDEAVTFEVSWETTVDGTTEAQTQAVEVQSVDGEWLLVF